MTENKTLHTTAPKDPTKKRSCFYVMIDTAIEATPRNEGKASQEIYLDNQRAGFSQSCTCFVNIFFTPVL